MNTLILPITQPEYVCGETKYKALCNSDPWYTKNVPMGEDSWSHYSMYVVRGNKEVGSVKNVIDIHLSLFQGINTLRSFIQIPRNELI